jgi:hypothetical protein
VTVCAGHATNWDPDDDEELTSMSAAPIPDLLLIA